MGLRLIFYVLGSWHHCIVWKSIKILCDCYKYLVESPLTGFPLDESDKEKRHQHSVSTAAWLHRNAFLCDWGMEEQPARNGATEVHWKEMALDFNVPGQIQLQNPIDYSVTFWNWMIYIFREFVRPPITRVNVNTCLDSNVTDILAIERNLLLLLHSFRLQWKGLFPPSPSKNTWQTLLNRKEGCTFFFRINVWTVCHFCWM